MVREFQKEHTSVYICALKSARSNGFRISKEDIDGGVIEFKVGASIWSFGETFKILITKIESQVTKVEVESNGSVGLQIIDWGKNKENIEIFFQTLTELLN
jgi:hypothetical protein